MTAPDREALGQMARVPAMACGVSLCDVVPWESLSDRARETWCRIGEALYATGRASRAEEVAALRADVDRLTRELAAAEKDRDLWRYAAKLGDRTLASTKAAVDDIAEQRDAAIRELDAARRARGDGDPGYGA